MDPLSTLGVCGDSISVISDLTLRLKVNAQRILHLCSVIPRIWPQWETSGNSSVRENSLLKFRTLSNKHVYVITVLICVQLVTLMMMLLF